MSVRLTLSVKTEGTTLKGSQMADGNSSEIFDGTVNGNTISWKVSITDPMPMTLEFNGMINDDEVTGQRDTGRLRHLYILWNAQLIDASII